MKTIKEHLESLPEPYRTQAFENVRLQNNSVLKFKRYEKSRALSAAFIFSISAEGFKYWNSLHSQLHALESQENISQQEKDEMIAEDMRNEADYEERAIEAERKIEDE